MNSNAMQGQNMAPSTNPNVVIDDALKAQFAQCKPGQTKPYAVTATMGQDGTITLSPDTSGEETAEPAIAVATSKKSKRPPVIAAVMPMA